MPLISRKTMSKTFWARYGSSRCAARKVASRVELQWASRATGISFSSFIAGMNSSDINAATRVSWKYGCSR
jgi:hypothetical protein